MSSIITLKLGSHLTFLLRHFFIVRLQKIFLSTVSRGLYNCVRPSGNSFFMGHPFIIHARFEIRLEFLQCKTFYVTINSVVFVFRVPYLKRKIVSLTELLYNSSVKTLFSGMGKGIKLIVIFK